MVNFGYINTQKVVQSKDTDMVQNILFSYEDYLKHSFEDFSNIDTLSQDIHKDYTLMTNEIRNITAQTGESMFSNEDMKDKVKQFFIKTWVFLVDVFNKFIELISNVLRSLAIYIRTKLAEHNKKMQDKTYTSVVDAVKKYNTDTNSNEYKTLNEILQNTKFKTIGTYNFAGLYSCVENQFLTGFIKGCRKSRVYDNLKVIYAKFKKEIESINYDDSDKKFALDNYLTSLSSKTDEIRVAYMLLDDETINKGTSGDGIDLNVYERALGPYKKLTAVTEHALPKELAHTMVFNTGKGETVENNVISISDFLGGQTKAVERYMALYKSFNTIVFDQLAVLEKSISTVREQFKVDKKTIMEIKNELQKQFASLDTGENLDKFPRIRALTDIIIRIKNFKQDYLSFRQYLVLDILRIKNCTDYAFNKFITICEKFPEEVGTYVAGAHNTKVRPEVDNTIFD